MINLVRYLGMALLLGVTVIFVLKMKIIVPISYRNLILLFLLGGISMLWANFRDKSDDKNK